MNGRKMAAGEEDQYRALLKEQEDSLSSMRLQYEQMQGQQAEQEKMIAELTDQVQQLKDQNALLKAHKGDSM